MGLKNGLSPMEIKGSSRFSYLQEEGYRILLRPFKDDFP